MKKIYILGLAACSLAACKPNVEPEVVTKGDADFTRYVAVGNSLTAGFADGSLYRNGQKQSYPAMLADQFAKAGGGEFKQPLLPGNDGWPEVKYILTMRKGMCDSAASIMPIKYPGAPDTSGSSTNVAFDGPYNNTGIPGIRCIDYIFPGYGMLNPYAKRFFKTPATTRPIDEVLAINPTFFTLWVGSNDILGYATGGGSTGTPISDLGLFTAAYDSIMNNLHRRGAKGVVLNIPDITSIPFFTTVTSRSLMLSYREANDLNALVYANTAIRFVEGANLFVIEEDGKQRQMRPSELVLMSVPRDSILCAGWGSKKPLPDEYVLRDREIDSIKTAVANFNAVIAGAANKRSIPMVDINSYLKTIQAGIKLNGITYNTTFVSGNTFSLDGIHLTPRGYALVANQIITRTNDYYKSLIPLIDPNKYPGTVYP